jgi:hypothetical protein
VKICSLQNSAAPSLPQLKQADQSQTNYIPSPATLFVSRMADQEDGAYPRINGGMLQSQQYNGMIVSAVGKIVGPNTLQAADGTNITLDTENIAEALVVNPDKCVEIIGSAQDATTLMVRLHGKIQVPSLLLGLSHSLSISRVCYRLLFLVNSARTWTWISTIK